MAAAQCTRIRLWRWRRSPLRRRSDLVEAWVVLAGWAFALVGGLIAGLYAVGAVERAADEQRERSRQVTAVLMEDTGDRAPARAASDYRVWAKVSWTGPDGATHTDDARVPPKTEAGTEITVWTDGRGQITAEPLTTAETQLHAVSGGILAALCTGGTVLGTAWLLRLWLQHRQLEQWALEWERIDTTNGWKPT
ncbi:hypothetical protein [Streptomyces sp. TRM68416]|uniref:Rv1733c family protein n=1 Tax=Streptomyces sp. TRM68416 TaxID=2758412 RepID=UPI001661EC12|nr:hypothetical protein [Streptomyces sp. TRM68416]MBD0838381.1 hypothetical protein [Streptomyces sp. TRM68416]